MNRQSLPCLTLTVLLGLLPACGVDSDEGANLAIAEPSATVIPDTPTAAPVDPAPATPNVAATPHVAAGSCGLGAIPGPPDFCSMFGGCPGNRCATLSASMRDWRADFPPSQANASCDPASNYAQPDSRLQPNATEVLHIVTVYGGDGAEYGPSYDLHLPGSVEVVVHASAKPIVLVLGASEAVRWQLTLEPGAQLSRVITQGSYDQEVLGVPSGVAVITRTVEETCGNTYGWEIRNGGGTFFGLMVADLRDFTGLIESSFQGCYRSARFEVPFWSGAPPTQIPTPIAGDENIARSAIDFPGCEDVMDESEYCLTTTSGGLALLGLDSGRLCHVVDSTVPTAGNYLPSLTWRGEIAYACGQAGLTRISVRDGTWQAAEVSCGSIADVAGGLLLMPSPLAGFFGLGGLRWYPDYEALLNGQAQCDYNIGWGSESMTANGGRWYGAWHASDSVVVGDFDAAEPIGVLTLERFDDWIWGMTATDAGHLVIGNGAGTVAVFDVASGRKLTELQIADEIGGLACTSRLAPGTPTAVPQPQLITPSPTPAPRPASVPSCAELAELADSPGLRANYSPSREIEKNCVGGRGSSNYANADSDLVADATEELDVISVYDAKANPGFRDRRQGTVVVNVAPRPKPIVLVLSASESVVWHLNVAPGAQLSKLILQGTEPQLVENAPAGTTIVYRGSDDVCANASGWEIANGGNRLMIADIRAYTGLVESSFQGCYAGAEFDVPYWTGEPPTAKPTPLALNEIIPREQVQFPGCEAVTQQSQYCLTTTYGGPAVVGLDTGDVCPVANGAPVAGDPMLASVAWRGEAMYVCGYRQGLTRVSLVDGSSEEAQLECGAVTDDRGSLLLTSAPFGFGAAAAYPSYAAILAGEPSAEYAFSGDSRMTAHDGRLYGAWHSTDTVDVFDLTTNQSLPPITLEDYNGWILGMAVTDAGELIISGDTWGDTIYVFDVATGAKLRAIHPTMPVFGLACVMH